MSPKPHQKTPKLKQQPRAAKIPKSAPGEDFYKLKPAWRINLLELADPFGWHELDLQQLHYVREKLADLEKRTWREILVSSGYYNHLIEVGRLCKEAKDRLEEIGQEDIDELLSLCLSGAERVWGILEHNVVKLLWWDPDHEVCEVQLRNT